ncbi:MAG: YgfZ/GcvT domain-containing protein [Thermoanaerobaculia bacterium]
MSSAGEQRASPSAYRAAREALAHRVREAAILDVEGPDREGFLQGQLTQDLRGLAPGVARPTAALTPKGKLLFVARLIGLPECLRVLLPALSRVVALDHLRKYALFQRVTVSDRSEELQRIGLYGPGADRTSPPPEGILRLSGEGEFSGELLVPRNREADAAAWLEREGSVALDRETSEALRVEAGRARFGEDIDSSNLPDEAGLDAALSATKGCYVGQEIVARRRTYGRVNRRLVGYRFPEGPIPAGARLRRPEAADQASERTEAGRVTSSALSPRFGPIGLGFAFHDVPAGGRLCSREEPHRSAIVSALPFA